MGVRVDMSGVPKKLDRIASNPELGAFAATETARLMNKFVPFRTGYLAGGDKAKVSTDNPHTDKPWQVSYVAPYAKRMYYGEGLNFYKKEHPKATSRWDKHIDKGALGRALTKKARSL